MINNRSCFISKQTRHRTTEEITIMLIWHETC